MAHCGGGEGPNAFDVLAALEQWVEQGRTPTRLIASLMTSGKLVRTRPLCPFPQVAHYTGKNSTDDAAHFVCRAP
jgi:feruloyl esterase